MTQYASSTGLPQNTSLQFNAIRYRTNIVSEIEDDNYSGGAAINAYRLPSGTVIMEMGPIPEMELSGEYVLRVFWEGSNLGSVELRVKIYEDDTLCYTIDCSYSHLSMNVGDSGVLIFDPRYSYTFKVEVGDLNTSNIKLDYIQLDQLYHGGTVNETLYAYDRGDGTPVSAIPVQERGVLAVTGGGGRGGTADISFNTNFCTTPHVTGTSGNGYLHPAITRRNTDMARVVMNHIDGLNWSDTQYFYWVAEGFVTPAFIPYIKDGEPDL